MIFCPERIVSFDSSALDWYPVSINSAFFIAPRLSPLYIPATRNNADASIFAPVNTFSMADGVSSSLGAILAGGMVSIFFSGTVTMQVIFYAKLYSTDRLRVKAVVALIWFLDILHTWLIGTAIWDYVISTWGNSSVLYHIPWTIAATIMLTALTTFIVQCFFAYRVYTVSYKNMYMTVAIVILALVRLGAALATTAEMVILEDYRVYKEHFSWLFTFGLVASAVLDITVTTSLIYFLRLSRTGTSPMDSIIDWLTFYTVQSGFLTFITTVVTIIVWLTMSNLIGIGMHLTITKLYANAFLATLNARKTLQVKQPSKGSRHLPFTASCHSQSLSGRPGLPETENIHLATKVHISVEETVHSDVYDQTKYGV